MSLSTNLNLESLGNKISALSDELEACYGHAAGVCLERVGHAPGVHMDVTGLWNETFDVTWNPVSDEVKRSWQDADRAVEFGACGIAFLMVNAKTAFKAVEVSRKSNGFDYWMAHKHDEAPFQNAARLEVSGILRENEHNTVKSRLRAKMRRLELYPDPLPVFIAVIEFGTPVSAVEQS